MKAAALIVPCLVLVACAKQEPAATVDASISAPLGNPADIATAESFIDAFYSFDLARLKEALADAPESQPEILFYQGWAEGGHYSVFRRQPCAPAGADSIACPVTVKDDLMAALRVDYNVTDTFTLKFAHNKIISVTTSSDDLPIYHDAKKWVTENRPQLVEVPCKDIWNGGPTPGDCVRGMVTGFAEYADHLAGSAAKKAQ